MTAEERAKAALAPLFNPEPHPLREDWSDAHSMNGGDMLSMVAQAIRSAEQARDERAAQIVEAMGKRRHMHLMIHGYGSEKPPGTKEDLGYDYVDEPHKTIAAAIRAPDTPMLEEAKCSGD